MAYHGEIRGYGKDYNCIRCGYHSKIWISSCPQCQQTALLAGPDREIGSSIPSNPESGFLGCIGIIALFVFVGFTWDYILWFWDHWFITLCLFFGACWVKVMWDQE